MRISHEERKLIYTQSEQKYESSVDKPKCSNGKKIAYSTRKKALKAMSKSRARSLKYKTHAVQSVYKCKYCGEWHLTKQMQTAKA